MTHNYYFGDDSFRCLSLATVGRIGSLGAASAQHAACGEARAVRGRTEGAEGAGDIAGGGAGRHGEGEPADYGRPRAHENDTGIAKDR